MHSNKIIFQNKNCFNLMQKSPGLILPDNATSIRENIVDTFSCENRIYGYYADMDNECQIFHVCLPQARHIVRFSFICPSETVFNQVRMSCLQNNKQGSVSADSHRCSLFFFFYYNYIYRTKILKIFYTQQGHFWKKFKLYKKSQKLKLRVKSLIFIEYFLQSVSIRVSR